MSKETDIKQCGFENKVSVESVSASEMHIEGKPDDSFARVRPVFGEIRRLLDTSDMILVGFGGEWEPVRKNICEEEVLHIYNALADMLVGKNYFIVSTCDDGTVYESNLDDGRITAPMFDGDAGEERWKKYNSWLMGTLNHSILILELGVGFDMPNVIRWPFENITMVNNRAYFYRVNGLLHNIPSEVADKSEGIRMNSVKFAKGLLL